MDNKFDTNEQWIEYLESVFDLIILYQGMDVDPVVINRLKVVFDQTLSEWFAWRKQQRGE
jgi:hypothetical protein